MSAEWDGSQGYDPVVMPGKMVEEKSGRWFISMGYPGFNSPANNGRGYRSAQRALAAIAFYTLRGKQRAVVR